MAETTVPGVVISLDAKDIKAQFEEHEELSSWLIALGAMMWAPFEEFTNKYFAVFDSDDAAWSAISALHLRPLPGNFDEHLLVGYVGPTSFALSVVDQRRVVLRLAQIKSGQHEIDPVGARQHESSQANPGSISWRGQVVPSSYLANPRDCHFRLKWVSVDGPGRELSRTWVKAIVEQGLHEDFIGDVSYVLVRPGYPYTDRQDIILYNLDFVFESKTHYIAFANSDARQALIDFMKQNMTGCFVGVGDPDSIGRPRTFPELTAQNNTYYAQAEERRKEREGSTTSTMTVVQRSTPSTSAETGWKSATSLPPQKDAFYARE